MNGTASSTIVAPIEDFQVVGITVYMRRDTAEVGRVLQILTRLRWDIDRFNANFGSFDTRRVRGLEGIEGPVMRLAIVGVLKHRHEVERITKALNRSVDVYKVIATFGT